MFPWPSTNVKPIIPCQQTSYKVNQYAHFQSRVKYNSKHNYYKGGIAPSFKGTSEIGCLD